MKLINKILAVALIIIMLFGVVSCDLISEVLPDMNPAPTPETDPDKDDDKEEDTGGFCIVGEITFDLKVGESIQLFIVRGDAGDGEIIWTSSSSCASVENGLVTGLEEGRVVISAILGGQEDRVLVNVIPGDTPPPNNDDNDGGTVIIPGTEDPITSDPYIGVDVDEFYENYTPAVSYMDSYYRSLHNLMSGSIGEQDQAPTVAEYQPSVAGTLIRNSSYLFSEDENTYYVVDGYGEIVLEIYRGGAYIMLEEVAAYVFAFGEPPANHSSSKKTKPTESPWAEYLRVNHTRFSGDTSRYPYEPVLPRISGCGGDLTYYEMDIGTTGTDCDPDFTATIYNNGYYITRGAARIVYSFLDKNGDRIIDLDERYVFYTYNHYNDFQEYLNYYGGWGEIFGNITGGGTISSKTDYNPTPYVETVRRPLGTEIARVVIYYYVPKTYFVA